MIVSLLIIGKIFEENLNFLSLILCFNVSSLKFDLKMIPVTISIIVHMRMEIRIFIILNHTRLWSANFEKIVKRLIVLFIILNLNEELLFQMALFIRQNQEVHINKRIYF